MFVAQLPQRPVPSNLQQSTRSAIQQQAAVSSHHDDDCYEEIGPGSALAAKVQALASQNGPIKTCDLCGVNKAILRCHFCSSQVFCSGCDDMYHRHPKRATHARKPYETSHHNSSDHMSTYLNTGATGGPIPPPRRNSRKNSNASADFSPTFAVHRSSTSTLSRSSTLPRNSMIGRPLPDTPASNGIKIGHSQSFRESQIITTTTMRHKQGSPKGALGAPLLPPPPLPPKPLEKPPAFGQNESALAKEYRRQKQIVYAQRAQFVAQQQQQQQKQQQNMIQHQQQDFQRRQSVLYPSSSPLPQPITVNGNDRRVSEGEIWTPYVEEVRFPPPAPTTPKPGTLHPAQRRRFNNMSRLHKSSSLHDIAHNEMNSGSGPQQVLVPVGPDGVPIIPQNWSTQPPLTSQQSMGGIPIQQHEQAMFNPMFNSGLVGQQSNRPPAMHRSMHELHNLGNPFSFNQQQVATAQQQMIAAAAVHQQHQQQQVAAAAAAAAAAASSAVASRSHSPTTSIRSKKSIKHSSSTINRHSRSKKASRPSSSASRHSRGYSRNSHQYPSSGEEDGNDSKDDSSQDSEDEDNETTEDFFTGESDNDFVSLSSGSGKAPRKSWVCEHCTYQNNPGISVCAMCCRTSKQSRGEVDGEETNGDKTGKKNINLSSKNQKCEGTLNKKNNSNLNNSGKSGNRSKHNSLKRNSKSLQPPPQEKEQTNSDLEDDAISTYYAVRHKIRNGVKMEEDEHDDNDEYIYEDSSDMASTSAYNPSPHRKPNFQAPPPAKGILKKCSSNPQLTNIANGGGSSINNSGLLGTQSEYGIKTKTLNQHLKSNERMNNQWMQQQQQHISRKLSNEEPNDYMSDVASTTNLSQLYRSISTGLVLQEEYVPEEEEDQVRRNNIGQSRRLSEVSMNGRRNFRSKRFSRKIETNDPNNNNLKRAQSLGHIEIDDNNNNLEDSPDGINHFIATVKEGSSYHGPGGIGSYLSRNEFGSNEGKNDSGYQSHGSGSGGVGGYPKLQLPKQAPIESFTMSVDRGFLGKTGENGDMYRSMGDLPTNQKAKGLELVRLLREAELNNFSAQDVQVALNHCGENNPVLWLKENWDNMIETVVTLASNVGHESEEKSEENNVGNVSKKEAGEALRKHKGNIWVSVTECVDNRQAKFKELKSKGNFKTDDIIESLNQHEGCLEKSYQALTKLQLKPFLMRIRGESSKDDQDDGKIEQEEEDQNVIEAKFSIKLKGSEMEGIKYEPGNLLKNISVESHDDQQETTSANISLPFTPS